MPLSPDLLAILVCPACKGDLAYDSSANTLTQTADTPSESVANS